MKKSFITQKKSFIPQKYGVSSEIKSENGILFGGNFEG